MTTSRRKFLGYGGLAFAGAVVGACSDDTADDPGAAEEGDAADDSGGGADAGGPAGPIIWWDPRQPIAEIQREIFAEFAQSNGGVPVDYTVYNPGEMGQSLQLAKQSNQMPDVFSVFGLDLPPRGLVDEGWFAPLDLDEQVEAGLPEGTLLEGINVFDGQVYGLPVNDFRAHNILTWFNREYVEQAGLDPDNPPTTYDEFRAAARQIQEAGDDRHGWIVPIGLPDRVGQMIHEFAEAAGSPTSGGLDLRTGEYQYHNEYHVAALEWWLALQQDGVLFPAATSLDAREARARWAGGAAGYFFDAQFNIGEVVLNFAAFEPNVGLARPAVPEAGGVVSIQKGPVGAGGTLWISAESEFAPQASTLISSYGTEEVQARLAEGMNAVPLFPEAVELADVHPLFREAAEILFDQVFLAPSPVVRNSDVALVQAEMRPIDPTFGNIVAGTMTGDVEDYRGALEQLSASMSEERDRAIAAVRDQGSDVSPDDWAFPDWNPRENYGPEKYA